MSFAICPSCGEEIRLRNQPRLGQEVRCPYCSTELEIVELDPAELDWPDSAAEDDWGFEETDD